MNNCEKEEEELIFEVSFKPNKNGTNTTPIRRKK